MEYIGLIGIGLLGIAGWALFRRRAIFTAGGAAAGPDSIPTPRVLQRRGQGKEADTSGSPHALDLARLDAVSRQVAERLWRLAYAASAESPPLEKPHAEVRVGIVARLKPEKLNPDYFPRRPTLMQQLMRAVDDPNAEADKLSRMIAHDPVIAADVLRIANSSLYRTTPEPIESVQRAIVVCGVDSLRGILATAMVRPVFRATRSNFPRLPRLLWERTERAARVAELYAQATSPQDRFEAQLAVLLRALGPLVVYSAALDAYAKRPRLSPNPALLVELTLTLSSEMSQRIAQEWGASARLVRALEYSRDEFLSGALIMGELLGSLSLLESHAKLSPNERAVLTASAGLDAALVDSLTIPLVPH